MVHLSPHTCPWCIPIPTPWGPKRFLFCWWVKPAWAIKIHRISIGRVCCCAGQQSYYLGTSINIHATWTQRAAAVANAWRLKFNQWPKVHLAEIQGNSWDRFIPRNFDSAWANGFLRRHTLITLTHSNCYHTVWFEVAKYSAFGPQKLWAEVILWALRKYYTLNGAGNVGFFWNRAFCMHAGMFVKNPCLLSGFTSFP